MKVVKYVFFVLVLAGVILEILTRFVFAGIVGSHVLLYGTPWAKKKPADERDVGTTGNIREGYQKYAPNDVRHDVDENKQPFEVRLNAQGFRGPDFVMAKAPGAARVITLGSSSTFGYHDRDDQTYPYYLEKYLREKCPARPIEVLNFGIPHLEVEEIANLFEAEGLPMSPDVVTFYEGINDASRWPWVRASIGKKVSFLSSLSDIIRGTLLSASMVHSLTARTRPFDEREVKEFLAGKPELFVKALERIRGTAAENGVKMVIVTQQVQSYVIPREELAEHTYEQELALVQAKFAREKALVVPEASFLAHYDMMKATRTWALEKNVPLADGIAATDPARDVLLSWVHLSPRGNQLIAAAIGDQVLPLICTSTAAAGP